MVMYLPSFRGARSANPESRNPDDVAGFRVRLCEPSRNDVAMKRNKRENAMLVTRREALAGCAGGLASLLISPAFSQAAYPSRTIKMIVPYPAGGTTDLLGRLVAEQLRSGLGATVMVENKPGAATSIGAEQVARAEPDGYTLLIATSTTLAINKTLYKSLPYDPVKDFTPIALVAGVDRKSTRLNS